MQTEPDVKTYKEGRNWIGALYENGQVAHTVVRQTESAARRAAVNREPRFNKPRSQK